jgi:hypothetical protein
MPLRKSDKVSKSLSPSNCAVEAEKPHRLLRNLNN